MIPFLQERLENAPLLESPYHHFLFESFFELSTERQIGMTIGPIPISAMIVHANMYGLTDNETLGFIRVMRSLDDAYLSIEREKAASEAKKAKQKHR